MPSPTIQTISQQRRAGAKIGTGGTNRLWTLLGGDPMTYRRIRSPDHFRLCLDPRPDLGVTAGDGESVAHYVRTMLPDVTPQDWWWTVAADGRIEVCVSTDFVETIEDGLLKTTDDLFEMTSLYPDTTGLPMTVWVSPRGARHDVRIKVNMTHGNQMSIVNTAVVSLRPQPAVIAGKLNARDQAIVFAWATKNLETLVAYWDGHIDTIQMAQRLQRV